MIETHRPHTYVLTLDRASLEAAKCDPALHIAIVARLLPFINGTETIRADGYHYMKRAEQLSR